MSNLTVVIPSRNNEQADRYERYASTQKGRENIKNSRNKFNHSEKGKAYKKAWRERNHDYMLKKQREHYARNVEKMRKRGRDFYNQHKESEADRIRLNKYGITGKEFRDILEKQHYKCPICGETITRNPSVDHSHITGKIRGIICNSCNLALGNVRDSIRTLIAMIKYLEETNG